MAETKHSPGPWYVRIGGNFISVLRDDIPLAEINIWYPFTVTDQHKADANLIAAAPDLLAACILLKAALNSQISEPDELEQEILDAARAAILKAKGED